MSQEQILLTCLFLICGCMVNSLVGFGAGLVSIPLLVCIDVPLPSAIVIVILSAFIQCAWMCLRYREHIPWRSAMPMYILRLLFLPAGVFLLVVLVEIGSDRIKQVLGGVLLLALFMIWALNVPPRPRLSAGWTALAGSISGILNGAFGMGGPAAVLWVMAHDWTSRAALSCLWSLIVMTSPAQLLLIWWKFGDSIGEAIVIGAAMTPACVVGTALGLRIGALLPIGGLRVAAYLVIALLAIGLIVGPMI